ncbi:alpha/beta fold hydrolase [Muricoccus radiodurans]|uniref:alpha/beta fold hydrolase n=1 Tax=Muricoccus radiodurans TaxID=2231721 RepID=UPI003CE8CB55
MTPRRGPRPLPLHLLLAGHRAWMAMAAIPSMTSGTGSPAWSGSWPGFAPRSEAARAERSRILAALPRNAPLGNAQPGNAQPGNAGSAGGTDALRAAVWRRLWEEDAALIRGIAAYRSHPWRRTLDDPPVAWREGPARLLDHGGTGPAVLFVPSLVNRATVLDLMQGHSMVRWLAGNGGRVMLLDWGWPGAEERGFTLTDWIAGRLERALVAARDAAGGPVVLAGYCMGGLLTLAAALRRPDLVRGLVLLATPWDFHAGGPEDRARAAAAARILPGLETVLGATGTLPVDWLQALFAGIDPFGIARKFRAFAKMDPDHPRTAHFVALEDWLNDGVPLPAPVARECLAGWYGENTPARGTWRVAGAAVDPARWRGPSFVAIPRGDRIVPPDSARALAARLPDAAVLEVAAGHIGMAAGMSAEAVLWRPLRDWLSALPPPK